MNVAIILSGGVGKRLGGDIPKQYVEVKGRKIIDYSLLPIGDCEKIDAVCIIAEKKWHQCIVDAMTDSLKQKFWGFAEPGANRQLSIYNGLLLVYNQMTDINDDDLVFIHDAARPNLSMKMIEDYLQAIDGYDGVMPVLPMTDTVYMCDEDGKVIKLLEREKIWAGQAPEVFRYKKYLEANEKLLPNEIKKINGSTEPAILAGMNILTVMGEEMNYKITTKEDLDKFVRQ